MPLTAWISRFKRAMLWTPERRVTAVLSLLIILLMGGYGIVRTIFEVRHALDEAALRGKTLARGLASVESTVLAENLSLVQKALSYSSRDQDVQWVIVLDRGHRIVASDEITVVGEVFSDTAFPEVERRGVESVVTERDREGHERLVVFEPLYGERGKESIAGWVIVELSLERVKGEAYRALLSQLALTSLLVVASVFVVRRIVRRLAEELRGSEERLRLVAKATNDVVWDWNLVTNEVWWNDGIHTLFAYAPDQVQFTAAWWVDHLHPEDRERIVNGIQAAIQGGKRSWTDEYRYRRADGSYANVFDRGYILRNEGGAAVRLIGAMLDITVRKRAERELKEAKDAAETANRAKSQFLACMSHEIRTPMNAIIGMADLLWETELAPDQRKYVRTFRRAGNALLTLINDILDLSKVESGQFALEATDFDLNEVLDRTIDMFALRASEKAMEFASHLAPDVPCHLVGDPQRLQQVLMNLVGNAFKFTEEGSVVLRVLNDPEGTQPGTLRFVVTDTGIGIPADKQAVIFERFTQADASTARKYGGTGLGLSISRHLVELMGGRLWVESHEGRGSTFSFTVKMPVQTQSMATRLAPVHDITGLRTLVVDDHPTNRLILGETLILWGSLVHEAGGGRAALVELDRAFEAGHPYQLLLLDCLMPDLCGFDVVADINRRPHLRDLTIVMLTSDRWAEDIARTYELGLGGYLVKPIRRAELREAIAIALAKTNAKLMPQNASPPQRPSCSPLRILLAEDSTDNQLLVQLYLKNTPHQVDVADNGQAAVEKFRAGRYDLVLMDMQMPVLDGYGATKAIRRWEMAQKQALTPILALTALSLKEEIAKSFEAGCNAHLSKPIRKSTLLNMLEAFTKISPRDAAA